MPGPCYGFVDDFEDIVPNHLALAEDADTCAISIKNVSVRRKLLEFRFGEFHKALNLVFGTVEVFDAEGIYGDHLDATLVANLHDLYYPLVLAVATNAHEIYPSERFESTVVAFYRLHSVASGITSVAVHLERDMHRDRSLLQGAYQQLAKLLECPFAWGGLEYKPPQGGDSVGHGVGCSRFPLWNLVVAFARRSSENRERDTRKQNERVLEQSRRV